MLLLHHFGLGYKGCQNLNLVKVIIFLFYPYLRYFGVLYAKLIYCWIFLFFTKKQSDLQHIYKMKAFFFNKLSFSFPCFYSMKTTQSVRYSFRFSIATFYSMKATVNVNEGFKYKDSSKHI